MRARTDELAELMTREGGKPLVENRDEVGWTASAFDFYAELARTSAGRVIPPVESSQLALVLKEPLGVVACIVPWNYPLLLLAWKLAPVLAAGNAAICKPSELTPLSTLALAPCLDHLPAGLVALLAGGGDVGERMVDDERVDCIAFTGSVATGTRIAERAATPDGAREPRAGRQGPVHRLRRRRGRDRHRGARRRLGRVPERRPGVHERRALLRAARGLRRLPERVRRPHAHAADRRPARPGDRRRPDGQRRPSATRCARRSTPRWRPARSCSSAATARATSAATTTRPPSSPARPPETDLLREETFGPVAPIVPVKDLDEAIALANGTPYGLGANVYTRDLQTAIRCARELRAGTVWINDPLTDNDAGPFGGCKRSGLGRELGQEGLDAFQETKHVHIETKLEVKDWWYPYG